ncbi:HTH-type transcriptional activator RhaR [Paenibacillus solanacearum]|uniref:HTH-type transcriptional activator RhaR n=1 Tax=Paenibacillus solanacearum TaxID=2048548 RepID=A0A916JSI8_9BACL|nr:AraC family transcriptional regulator [Paenibacillus solanacearum]CAG7599585.1 HTH-type transcriptional activator RhaR [Paenibacillus solanacearum]
MHKSYGFRYTEGTRRCLHLIETIGRESTHNPTYSFDGLHRDGPGLLFQYTLSGEGRLELGNTTYRVPRHHGFFVTIPSAHRYYYDPSVQTPWEFIWIKLNMEGSSHYWQHFVQSFGPVAAIKPDSDTILLLQKLYNDVAAKKFADSKYDMSVRVHEWLLTLLRLSEGEKHPSSDWPEPVRLANQFIERHYGEPVSLEQIANAAQLSKHYLCKTFRKFTGTTPIDYLRKLRIEEAVRLLQHTDIPISQIAMKTGFDNASYFGKVFHQLVGITPTEFRQRKSDLSADYLHIMR